jgi:hypothetical protein
MLWMFIAFSTSAGISQEKEHITDIPVITACDLVNNPIQYDQKIVRVSDTYVVTFEGSAFYNPACNPDIWVKFDSSVESATNSKVLKKFKRLSDVSPIHDSKGGVTFPDARLEILVKGRFEGEKPPLRIGDRLSHLGYGHLGMYKYQFVVQEIEHASKISTKKR